MIEDQLAPKRCGHTAGKSVVDREEAFDRVRAAVETRDAGADIVIMARTDARATHGLDEAILRARTFSELGADILFVEAPESESEMRRVCADVPGIHLANMVHGGTTPILAPEALEEIGYRIAAYPLALLSAATHAMNAALDAIASGSTDDPALPFADLREIVGFDAYDEALARFARGSGSN
jgi:2-methylisocitrate lyase-like PEP mutase family enzyme